MRHLHSFLACHTVTAGDSDMNKVGNSFLQLKLVLDRGTGTEEVFMGESPSVLNHICTPILPPSFSAPTPPPSSHMHTHPSSLHLKTGTYPSLTQLNTYPLSPHLVHTHPPPPLLPTHTHRVELAPVLLFSSRNGKGKSKLGLPHLAMFMLALFPGCMHTAWE